MRELKDRLYFFVPTRMSLGILLAYRDDIGQAVAGQDVEDIYKIKSGDKDVLIRALEEQEPFAKLIECKRANRRVPVVFTRSFADRNAMYCAIELKWDHSVVKAVTLELGFGELVLPDFDELEDAAHVDSQEDIRLFKYLNTIYSSNAEPIYPPREWPDSPVDVADCIMAICEFLGVQLELDLTMDIWEHTESRFSFKRCAEMVSIFGCVARRYTRERLLGVELCKCFDNFRLKFSLDLDCEDGEQQATAVLGEFARIFDVAIASERGEVFVYVAIPMEIELEVAGVKEEF